MERLAELLRCVPTNVLSHHGLEARTAEELLVLASPVLDSVMGLHQCVHNVTIARKKFSTERGM